MYLQLLVIVLYWRRCHFRQRVFISLLLVLVGWFCRYAYMLDRKDETGSPASSTVRRDWKKRKSRRLWDSIPYYLRIAMSSGKCVFSSHGVKISLTLIVDVISRLLFYRTGCDIRNPRSVSFHTGAHFLCSLSSFRFKQMDYLMFSLTDNEKDAPKEMLIHWQPSKNTNASTRRG